MKKLFLLILLIAVNAPACGPFFPPSYFNDRYGTFVENINVPLEILLLAREYGLIGPSFTNSSLPSIAVERDEFTRALAACGGEASIDAYVEYAGAVRAGPCTNTLPAVPDELLEFTLYLEGYGQMQSDPELTEPAAWMQLLQLTPDRRHHRTTWVYYMLGNLASGHGMPGQASIRYAECRQAATDGFADALGLAHASYKREQLAQTNRNERIRCGVQAAGYYRQTEDETRLNHCMAHLQRNVRGACTNIGLLAEDPVSLEAAALFQFGNPVLIDQLASSPPLRITPRLAWFMYQSGRIDEAQNYLQGCPDHDALANWLRFRIAQRNGQTGEAIAFLRLWLADFRDSDRIIYRTRDRYTVSAEAAAAGELGQLLSTQGDLIAALDCFVRAGSVQDASLIAERYLETDALQAYVDTFYRLPSQFDEPPPSPFGVADQPVETVQYRLSNLLARRLFREGRPADAAPYYSPPWAEVLEVYLDALAAAEDPRLHRNVRAAHLYHAARIMRWKGMELSGTMLAPDYTISRGNYARAGIQNESGIPIPDHASMYAETAPEPDRRFHYRTIAADMAGRAAQLSRNRHQRALLLWTAGEWIRMKYPVEADIYYKQLARIWMQPLAKAADKRRWFPPATPELETVFRSEEYIPPEMLATAARRYSE